jgi:hypothetical protein
MKVMSGNLAVYVISYSRFKMARRLLKTAAPLLTAAMRYDAPDHDMRIDLMRPVKFAG